MPRRHVGTIYELSTPEQGAIWTLVGEARERLLTGLKPDGFNIGLNDGPAAGPTVRRSVMQYNGLRRLCVKSDR